MQNLSNNLLLQIKIRNLQLSTRSENMAANVTPTKCYQRDIGNVCCLCGSESVQLQVKIFSKTGEKKQMAEKIFKATGLRIENNKHLPQAICRKCKRTVESIISFEEKVIEIQHVFNTDSTVKRIIDMSPSQEKLSEKKKLATDKQVSATDKQVSSSRQLRFDDIAKISDVIPRGVTRVLKLGGCTFSCPTKGVAARLQRA